MRNPPDERAAWLRLALCPGLAGAQARALLAEFGLPTALFHGAGLAAPQRRRVLEICGATAGAAVLAPPGPAVAAALARAHHWLAQEPGHSLLCLADADYPAGLLHLGDPPLVLYAAGRRECLAAPAIAIVGSRNATRQGAQNAAAFAAHLGRAGWCIVSGMARGIDAAAHQGALDAGAPSIGVLGTGIDVVYPAAQSALSARMASAGLLLSELPLGSAPHAFHFPRRNRLIAALARGVLVVEAALRSGSLITARLAADLGRAVYAIPGSIHSPLSRGCHRLLRDGATLVESAHDVLAELPGAGVGAGVGGGAPAAPQPTAPADAAGATVLAALGHDPVDIDTLARRVERDAGSVTATLLDLELAQRVERLPGNRYQRLD